MAGVLPFAPHLFAQSSRQGQVLVAGHVMRPGTDDMEGMGGAWVILHRVGSDSAGPIDSVISSPQGNFRFTFHPFGAPDAVYFASVTHHGIAYFTPPLKGEAGGVNDHADITVFDTTSVRVPITTQGRHLIVSAPNEEGERTVTEVFELSNDSSVTWVATGSTPAHAVWSIGMPSRARHPAVTEGDIQEEVVRFSANRALLFATLPPGIKQFVFQYSVAERDFPLSIPVEYQTPVLEVLLEEPTAEAEGARLQTVEPAVVASRRFRRFLGNDVPANGVITLTVPHIEQPVQSWYLVGLTLLIGGAMVGTLIYALRKK